MRLSIALTTIVFAASGCAVLKGMGGGPSGPSGPSEDRQESSEAPSAERTESDYLEGEDEEEAGINAISQRLRQFKRALDAKDFENAGRLLRRAELEVENADELTRGHPEFEDKEDAIARAKVRFEEALERDRIERRNAAIAELTQAGEITLERGRALFVAMNQRVPTEDDVASLVEVLERLGKLRADGSQYEKYAGYKAHADQRDAQAEALRDRLKIAQWQLATSEYLDASITRGERAVQIGQEAQDRDTQLKALQAAAVAFEQCVDQFEQLAARKDYDGARLVRTAFGEKTLDETRLDCGARQERFSGQLASVQWNALVKAVVAEVDATLGKYDGATSARKKLLASDEASAALRACVERMGEATSKVGYDRRKTFASPFGELTVSQLQRSCTKRGSAVAKEKPRLVWKAELEGFASSLDAVTKATATARAEENPAKAAVLWEKAVAALDGCKLSAATLARKRNADGRYETPTPFGPLTVKGIETECITRLQQARQSVEDAEREKKLRAFLATVKGDEVRVAKERGIPSRIESVQGGRIFYYQVGRNETAKFGFDSKGNTRDFDAEWSKGFDDLASGVTKALAAIDSASDGTELKRAVTNAVLTLRECSERLKGAEKLPGASPGARRKTPLGNLDVVGMQRACQAEMNKQRTRMPAIEWQIALEAIEARAGKALTAIEDRSGAAKDRIQRISRALGSFDECREAAEALDAKPGANERLTLKGPFGKVSRRGLIAACEKAKKDGTRALSEARSQADLDAFIAKAQGDEKAVAERDGMPDRIEKNGDGRVFIYGTGKSAKRIAFDGKGRRVVETPKK